MKGIVANIQRYSLNDGLGIRTIVFLKGCPLRCRWCSNPETQTKEAQIMFHAARCIDCKSCREVCPQRLALPVPPDWEPCTRCGLCQDACPAAALGLAGREMGVREVLDVVARDRPFYGGGGGITLSGGEVLVQWEFAAELAKMASETYHLHVAVETTGHGEWERLLAVAKYCDEILYDIKHMDDERHRYGTYAGNALILENLRKLAADAADRIKIRIPLIEGYNADDANIAKVCELGKELGIGEIHLLPYHQFGEPKYAKLGWAYAFDGRTPDDRAVERIRDRLENDGFKVTVGG